MSAVTGRKKKVVVSSAVVRPLILFALSVHALLQPDEIPDPSKLTIRSFVNDDKMQESGTR